MFEFSIYTIAHGAKLAKAARKSRATKFSEAKIWKTGDRLQTKAKSAGAVMPVVFGDATNCRYLLWWGILKTIVIEDTTTHYFVEQVRPIKGKHTPQELVLRSTGKHIAPNFIRPYAICRTPSFLA